MIQMSNFIYSLQCQISDIQDKIRHAKWATEEKISDLAWTAECKTYDSLEKTETYIKENPKKSAAIVAAGVLSGGLAYANAPFIATTIAKTGILGKTATTGAVIKTLTGAPLTRAALAKIGFGALSIGGKGIAGGKVIIATTATTASTATASKLANLNKKST
jgi:hypothetical protein